MHAPRPAVPAAPRIPLQAEPWRGEQPQPPDLAAPSAGHVAATRHPPPHRDGGQREMESAGGARQRARADPQGGERLPRNRRRGRFRRRLRLEEPGHRSHRHPSMADHRAP
ncbi:hypothetical protein BS78_03G132600 [Paspalum vaginatum]|nr:hypothetical protein BS78_03G132600 [Paspalum vaginatum]